MKDEINKEQWIEYYKNYISEINKILNEIMLLDSEELVNIQEQIRKVRGMNER